MKITVRNVQEFDSISRSGVPYVNVFNMFAKCSTTVEVVKREADLETPTPMYLTFFYVNAGGFGGVRFLWTYIDGKPCLGRHGLHSTNFLALPYYDQADPFQRILSRAASTIQHSKLTPIGEVHDFDEGGHHKQGWYTKSLFGLQVPAPTWAPDARCWNLREGVYLYFPDGSIRLCPKKEFYKFEEFSPLLEFRQGDVFFCEASEERINNRPDLDSLQYVWTGLEAGKSLRSHTLTEDDQGRFWVLEHPEHETLKVEKSARIQSIVMMPGTSRPFTQAGGGD